MIYGHISDSDLSAQLSPVLQSCLKYAGENDLLSRESGKYSIDGENLFVNILRYETAPASERFWEAHREYLDLHLMLQGQEQIDLAFLRDLEEKEYHEDEDFLALEGKAGSHVTLSAGDCLVCFPEDAHKTAIAVDKPQHIQKAVFKIRRILL